MDTSWGMIWGRWCAVSSSPSVPVMMAPMPPMMPREEMARTPPPGMRVAILVVISVLARPVIDLRLRIDATLAING